MLFCDLLSINDLKASTANGLGTIVCPNLSEVEHLSQKAADLNHVKFVTELFKVGKHEWSHAQSCTIFLTDTPSPVTLFQFRKF